MKQIQGKNNGDDRDGDLKSPSIVNMGTSSEESRRVYDAWAKNYEHDIRKWGYNLPERAASLVREHVPTNPTQSGAYKIMDAGGGDGLSGVALREAGFDEKRFEIIGTDLSPAMLDIAKERKCYNKVEVVDLQKSLPYDTNSFDAILCIGTLTYVDPKSGVLDEFVRVTKTGGLICYSNRTDKLDGFKEEEERLVSEGKWKEVSKVGPIPYLPDNPDYGDKVMVVIYMYCVS